MQHACLDMLNICTLVVQDHIWCYRCITSQSFLISFWVFLFHFVALSEEQILNMRTMPMENFKVWIISSDTRHFFVQQVPWNYSFSITATLHPVKKSLHIFPSASVPKLPFYSFHSWAWKPSISKMNNAVLLVLIALCASNWIAPKLSSIWIQVSIF
jgi:hypothetical protein